MNSKIPSLPTPRALPGLDARKRTLSTRVTRDRGVLESLQEAWADLAEHTVSPNPFLEPMLLLPALEHLDQSADLEFLLIEDGESKDPCLCGLFVLQPLPLGGRSLWKHRYQFDATPLLRADCANAAIEAFIAWFEASAHRYLRVSWFNADSTYGWALHSAIVANDLPVLTRANFMRAEFRPGTDAASYLRANLSRSTRKNLQRLQRRLVESEGLTVEVLQAEDDAAAWADDFLDLEAAGWRGRGGSSMRAQPADARFFKDLICRAHAQQKLLMVRLLANGEQIAMNSLLLSGDGGHYFKICYNEAFAKYSPGQILELCFIELLHDMPQIRWLDSCAKPNHDMIDRLWRHRRNIQELWLGKSSVVGDVLIGAVSLATSLKSAWRRLRSRAQ